MNPGPTTPRTRSPRAAALAGLGLAGLAAVAALAALGQEADAQAVVSNGVVELGVDAYGQLNLAVPGAPPSCGGTMTVGLRFVPTGCEATAPACLCEGWGIQYDGTTSGWANNAYGGPGGAIAFSGFFPVLPFSATAVSTVGDLTVSHLFTLSAVPELYLVDVQVTNGGALPHDVSYRRVVDLDVEPTPFSEFITIDDFGSTAGLIHSCNNGFATPDILGLPAATACAGATPGPFTDLGPQDHGALFEICLGTIPPGATIGFQMYYGAAKTEAAALGALGAVGATFYALGQTSTDPAGGTPNTFILGFGDLAPLCPPPPVAGCEAYGIRVTESDSLGGSFVTGYGHSTAGAVGSGGAVPAPSPLLAPPSPASATGSGALHAVGGTFAGIEVAARVAFSECAVLAAGGTASWLTEAYAHAGIEGLRIGFPGNPLVLVETLDFQGDAYGDPFAATGFHACDYGEARVNPLFPPTVAAFCRPFSVATTPPLPAVTVQGNWMAPPVALGNGQWMYEGSVLRVSASTPGGDTVTIDVGYVRLLVTEGGGLAVPSFYLPNGPCMVNLACF